MQSPLNIVVSAALAQCPGQGGWAWVVLQYLLGLRQLGHNVTFFEQLPAQALQPAGCKLADSHNADYWRQVLQPYELCESSSLVLEGTYESLGLDFARAASIARSADVILNLSGKCTIAEVNSAPPIRVYVDLDPAFTQIWQEAHGIDMHLNGNTHFVTVGHELGKVDCIVPTCGKSWITTNQPISLKHWPVARNISYPGLTTVANWRGYGSAEYRGEFYGQKAHSLRELIDLPRRCNERFILALGIHRDETQDLALLRRNKWEVIDPAIAAATPTSYQQFVQGSKAEFGIAKSGYVRSRCGWFSDRSVCYLASGRPVIAQDTGFSRSLPTGRGLFAFDTAEQVCDAIAHINSNYQHHASAARQLAEEFFDSDVVLNRLLREVGAL